MSLLRPTPVSTDHLTFMPDERQYVGEISELPGQTFGAVWNDSADSGMTLVFPDGTEIVCVLDDAETDADGDVVSWTLHPVDRRDRNFSVVIFND